MCKLRKELPPANLAAVTCDSWSGMTGKLVPGSIIVCSMGSSTARGVKITGVCRSPPLPDGVGRRRLASLSGLPDSAARRQNFFGSYCTSVIVFVNNLLWFVFYFMLFACLSSWSLVSFAGFQGLSYLHEFSFILFIHHNFHIYFESCTCCKIWDIYLLLDMNSVKYLLFYMELFCDMFGSVLECYELTHISCSSLIPRQDHASLSTQLSRESCKSEHALLPHWLCNQKHPSGHM